MKKKLCRTLSSFLFIFFAAINFVTAQVGADDKTMINNQSTSDPDMATGFYAEGKIYVVVGVIAIILTGIFLYLLRLDNKMKKIEKEMRSN